MGTLQELRKRKAELLAERKQHSKILDREVKKKKLKQDIRELKHPKTYKTARAFKKFATAGLKGAGRTTKKLIKKQLDIGATQGRKKTRARPKRRRRKR